jgi:hypothetical protein
MFLFCAARWRHDILVLVELWHVGGIAPRRGVIHPARAMRSTTAAQLVRLGYVVCNRAPAGAS